MAIVKNTRNSDTAITLRVFRKNTNIKSLIPDAGQYVTAMYPKYYLQLNNAAVGDASGVGIMPRIWDFRAGDGFIIRAEISANASGPFWGGVSNNSDVSIGKSDNTILWYLNGDAIASVPYESGIHDYGFTGFEVNGVKYSQAYYDGAVVSGSSPENFSDIFPITLIGGILGPNVDPECIHGSDYGIRVYDAIADTSEGSWHLYPYNQVDSASGGGMFETLNRNGGERCKRTMNGSSAGGTSSVSVGEFPSDISGIGLQLPEDLRAITGSGYFDLIPLMFEDGGIDTLAGWTNALADTNPSKVSEPNQPDKYFAFYIGLSSDYTNIPLPDDCTATKGGSTSYAIGELIRGRKPKWNIWNDQIRFGKYAITLGSGARKVYFNIFYDNYGVNQDKFDLENMENYNTATYHAPNIGLSGEINFEYYNGFCSKCNYDTKLLGSKYDRCCVFAFNREGGGIGNVKLGNLPLWNYTDAEQQAAVQTGLANLMACGAGLRITCQGATGLWEEIAMMCKSVKDTGDMVGAVPKNFSSDSNTATQRMFRAVGFDATSIISDKSIEYMRDLLYEFCTRAVHGELLMLKSIDSSPAVSAQIDCTDLIPVKQSTAKGMFDNIFLTRYPSDYHVGTGDDRFIVGEAGGKATIGNNSYNIEIFGTSPSNRWGSYGQTDVGDDCMNQRIISQIGPTFGSEINHGYGIDLGFALKTPDADSCLKIFGSDQDTVPVMAFLSVFAQSKTTVATYDEEISTAGTQAFTSRQAQGNYKGCDATIDVGTVIRTDNSSTSVTFNVYLPYSSSGTSSKLVLYVSTNSTITRCEFDMWYTQNAGEASVLTINVSDVTVGSEHYARISGSVYKNNVTIHTDITSSYHLSNKYFGFTKVVNCCSNTSIRNYEDLFIRHTRYEPTKIQPSGYNITGGRSYNTNKWRGSAIFMWKDLTCRRDIQVGSEPVTPTQRPSDGITCYMRVFAQDSGVHSWMPVRSKSTGSSHQASEAYFDTISENLHCWVDFSVVKDIYFHNPGELISNSTLGSSNFVDAWITLWDTTQNPHSPQSDHQVTAANALDGKTLTLYEEVLHEPKDSTSGADPVELCHFTFDSSASYVTGKDSDNQDTDYHLYMQSGQTAPFFTRLPINNTRYGEFDNSGFYNLWITNSSIQPSTGSMYYIKIS